jgi:cyclopropane fatty-acyl-phospholipid synthase-like methyltransferase
VPTEFFKLVMGKYMKYSCCHYSEKTVSLDEAEENMLSQYLERAQIKDGQDILDLG